MMGISKRRIGQAKGILYSYQFAGTSKNVCSFFINGKHIPIGEASNAWADTLRELMRDVPPPKSDTACCGMSGVS